MQTIAVAFLYLWLNKIILLYNDKLLYAKRLYIINDEVLFQWRTMITGYIFG